MKANVFYSWQSDRPNSTNRGFIQDALEGAIKDLKEDAEIAVEPVIDRDTMGVAGSPDIGLTILAKIDASVAFIGDVSFVATDVAGDPAPNPNVLIELGYAMKALGYGRIVMVLNTAFGPPEKLPFDLRQKRTVTYHLPEGAEKASVRKELRGRLAEAIKTILREHQSASKTETPPPPRPSDEAILAVRQGRADQGPVVSRFMLSLTEELKALDPHELAGEADEKLVRAIEMTKPLVDQFGRVAEVVADMNADQAGISLTKGFEAILRLYDRPAGSGTVRSTDFDLFKFVGHEMCTVFFAHLMRASRWDLIGTLAAQTLYVDHPSRGPAHIGLRILSSHLALLDVRAERLKTPRGKRISIHADLLKERHDGTPPVGGVNWDEFRGADLLLALALDTTAPSGRRFYWFPRSSIYLNGSTPRFLVDAQTHAGARELGKALHESDVGHVRTRVKAALQNLAEGISQMGINVHFGYHFDSDEIGSIS